MRMFEVGDSVIVTDEGSVFHKRIGTVTAPARNYGRRGTWTKVSFGGDGFSTEVSIRVGGLAFNTPGAREKLGVA